MLLGGLLSSSFSFPRQWINIGDAAPRLCQIPDLQPVSELVQPESMRWKVKHLAFVICNFLVSLRLRLLTHLSSPFLLFSSLFNLPVALVFQPLLASCNQARDIQICTP